ncbi:MutS-related protein [Humibacter ginsenosidimutans]|uniref:DNA mismatch repair protein MutS n=1 Tax=Humibacter ginsenosidimutans TaxID=2599293 RepID=A0A5B8M303_9MICO|nr:DNA mismatch repair protein MutS [Humibacter ginsenosidimutans]QDZ14329.1 DNA mismatch repair protein MutS [Humibacter ginsenosidimutans]
MKTYLLFADRDLPAEPNPLPNAEALTEDLGLDPLIAAMGTGDGFLEDAARRLLLEPLVDVDDILYRQQVLSDCMRNEGIVRELYALALDAFTRQRKVYGWLSDRNPGATLSHAVQVLEIFVSELRTLRLIAVDHAHEFESAGFRRFFEMTVRELDDAYFAEIDRHLRRLRFRGSVMISAHLDRGGKPSALVLRRPEREKRTIGERWSALTHPIPAFRIAERDEAGADALNEFRGKGMNLVADALARSTDHILSFFSMLRLELGFYIGCLNLIHALDDRTQHTSMPVPVAQAQQMFACDELYDPSLALVGSAAGGEGVAVVGNTIDAGSHPLMMVTGANRGGKSTFLRSRGLAQLMMQAGMVVPARAMTATVASGVFTHFKREEDTELASGKFDEELARMNEIVGQITPASLMLFNESFAATNEREGSEIARQIVRALLDSGIRVVYVTHLYDLAHGFVGDADAFFLRAERERTFRLVVGEPLPTSFGGDLYRDIFRTDPANGRPVEAFATTRGT